MSYRAGRCSTCGLDFLLEQLPLHESRCCKQNHPTRRRYRHVMDHDDERKPAAVDLTQDSPTTSRSYGPVIYNVLDDDDDEDMNVEEVKPPAREQDVEDSEISSDEEESDEEDDDDDEVIEFWPCPRCTLHNTNDRACCAACNAARPGAARLPFQDDSVRSPERVRLERLIGFPEGVGSPLAYMSGGALLGGIAGAYMSSSHPTMMGNVVPGAVSGAVSGAMLREMLRSNGPPPPTAAAASLPFPPRVHQVGDRMFILHNGRIAQTTPPPRLLRRTPAFAVAGGRFASHDPALLQRLIAGMAARGNVDGMGHDELLRMFGNGTENMGAREHEIEQLPLATITDVEKELPEDCRTCSICLETFEAGNERRTLPCLHGFHKECADKWLKSNGTCPICKNPVRG